MDATVERAEVWAASMKDEPGALADKLAALAKAGADLGFVIARRSPEKPGTSVVFVTPLRGEAETAAAAEAGFALASSLHSVRIEGDNKSGMGAQLTGILGDAGINLRGLSAAVIGSRFVVHLALDAAEDADKAMALLRDAFVKS